MTKKKKNTRDDGWAWGPETRNLGGPTPVMREFWNLKDQPTIDSLHENDEICKNCGRKVKNCWCDDDDDYDDEDDEDDEDD